MPMPVALPAAPELSPGGRLKRHRPEMSPEQEASPPPATPGAPGSPLPQTTTTRFTPQTPTQDHSDVEQFAGKIVYNPDGSAYIIEESDSEASETGGLDIAGAQVSLPQLHAVYVSRLLAARRQPDAPAVHSYRVVALRDARPPPRPRSVPVKPILMCFVCKLSFGYARSFAAHAQSEHGVTLQDAERDVLLSDCSAILQLVGADKKPLVSLLEPLGPATSEVSVNHPTLGVQTNDCTTPPQSNGSSECAQSLVTHARRPSDTSPCPQRKSPPVNSVSPPFTAPSPATFLTGTTIGVCPEHIQGRPSGVECQRCEMILASGRLGTPAGLAHPHSRNSCKTLKCPKCNWHYKYQETLEIHMKEKHPEAETSCIYCIAGQPHPRLARGETYTCGYKPYRCEVCNYSTTTKGNLSIHMQSDKHLNNMQELQNGGGNPVAVTVQDPTMPQQPSPKSTPLHHSPVSSGATSHKPKPTFRCDVCNYETNVARNLRIHMTSEKHTHNMLVLQQNVKHMQTLSAIHQHQQQSQQQHLETLFGSHFMGLANAATSGGDKPEAALADMAYNQALLIQMMTGGQIPGHLPAELAPHLDMGLNPETMEPPPEPADPNPDSVFTCCVCNAFNNDNLEALGQHLARDRTKTREQEILALVAGHYVCKLCTYKTNLKANFQLHCKTDKHLQRLQHVNHVKEGGPRNEWRLKYVSAPGGVQVRCNACDYYTNSAHKLQLHAAGARHEAAISLFRHISERCRALGVRSSRAFLCALCGFSAPAKLGLLQHVRSMKHMHMEQLHQLQKRQDGQEQITEIGDVFQVVPQPGNDFDEGKSCFCIFIEVATCFFFFIYEFLLLNHLEV